MVNKWVVTAIVLNFITFLALFSLQQLNTSRIVYEIREAAINNRQRIGSLALLDNFHFALFITFFIQVNLSVFINLKLITTKKQLFTTMLAIFIILITLLSFEAIPSGIQILRCKNEISQLQGNASGRCFTLVENSRAYVVLIFAAVYVCMYTAITFFISMLFFRFKQSSKSYVPLWLAIISLLIFPVILISAYFGVEHNLEHRMIKSNLMIDTNKSTEGPLIIRSQDLP